MKKILLLFITALLMQSVSATFISGDIFIDQNGYAIFDLETDIPLDIPGLTFNNYIIAGKTNSLTSKQGDLWTFHINQNTYDNILLDIHLPKGLASISEIRGNDNIIDFPDKTITLIDSGALDFSISYKLKDTRDFSFLIWLAIIIVIVVSLLIYFKLHKKKDRLNALRPLIGDQEEKIIDSLMKGPKRQKEIRKELNIPKASFTRYLINLEKKKLILREGDGKNKVIKLK